MRLEIAALRRQAGLPCRALIGAAQSVEPFGRRDAGKDRPRLAAAKTAKPVQPKLERVCHDLAQCGGEIPRGVPVDIADEAERQMIVLGIDPTRAGKPRAQQRQPLGDAAWDFDRGKKPWHRIRWC